MTGVNSVYNCLMFFYFSESLKKADIKESKLPTESISAKTLVEMTGRVKRAESQVEITAHQMKKMEEECRVSIQKVGTHCYSI